MRGTLANRTMHCESQQLFVGSCSVDINRTVRVIPNTKLY